MMPVRTRGTRRNAPRRVHADGPRRHGALAAGLGLAALALVALVAASGDERAVTIAAFAAVGALWLALVALAIVRGLERADARAKTLGLRRTLAGHRIAEESLDRTERFLRAGSFHVDARTRRLTTSAELGRVVGGLRPRRDNTLEDLIARVHGEDRNFVRGQFERALNGATALSRDGTVLNFACRVVLPTGEVRPVQVRAGCEREVAGTVRAVFGVAQDASAGVSQPRVHGALDAAFENAAVPTALVGLSGSDRGLLVRVNGAFSSRLGHPAADLVGEPLADLGGPDYAAKIDDHLAELRTLGGASCFAIRCTLPSGELVPFRVHQACIADADGEPRYAVIQLVDGDDPRRARRRRFAARHDEVRSL